jgi:hypothetical protein
MAFNRNDDVEMGQRDLPMVSTANKSSAATTSTSMTPSPVSSEEEQKVPIGSWLCAEGSKFCASKSLPELANLL